MMVMKVGGQRQYDQCLRFDPGYPRHLRYDGDENRQ
jgi:hypothetical protein